VPAAGPQRARPHPSRLHRWQHAGTCGQRRGEAAASGEEAAGVGMWELGSGGGPILASPRPWVPGGVRRGLVDAGSLAVLYGLRGLH